MLPRFPRPDKPEFYRYNPAAAVQQEFDVPEDDSFERYVITAQAEDILMEHLKRNRLHRRVARRLRGLSMHLIVAPYIPRGRTDSIVEDDLHDGQNQDNQSEASYGEDNPNGL